MPSSFDHDRANLSPAPSSATGLTVGTKVVTTRGETPAEDLRPGDHIFTLDHGYQTLKWIGVTRRLAVDDDAPIRIRQGAIGLNLPIRDLIVAPEHRILLRSTLVARLIGTSEALVAARHLTGLPGIGALETGEYQEYVHLLFDQHELILADGTPCESLHLGKESLIHLDQETREEIYALNPDAVDFGFRASHARDFLSQSKVARKLCSMLMLNGKAPMEHRRPCDGRAEYVSDMEIIVPSGYVADLYRGAFPT